LRTSFRIFFSSFSQFKMSRVSIVDHGQVAELEQMISDRDAKIDYLTSSGHRGSSIEMRKVSINAGAAKRPSVGGSSLKMAIMSLGGQAGGQTITKVLATDPQSVVESREKEKESLQILNERFAAYIEKVRFLEADNKRLQSIIDELTAKFHALDAALRAIYEEELKAARTALDKTTAAKGAAELRAYNAEAKLKEMTAKYNAESSAHVVTKEKIPALEKMISERDAQIDFLTKNLAAIEIELTRLKGQSSSLQGSLTMAKQERDNETVARVELESIVQTKEDEIVFLKSMYEEKMKTLMSLDFGAERFRADFSNELALALRDIRGEYESIMEATRMQDTDAWYRAKFNEVMAVTSRQSNDLAVAKEEVRNWRNKYHQAAGDLSAQLAIVAGLNSTILELKAQMEAAAAAHALEIADKQAEITRLNYEITRLITSLRELTDVKLALDAEIATYRRLLMAEDGRIYKSSIDQSEQTTKTITTTTRTIVNPFIMTFAEEEAYFAQAFAYCDADKSGHVTTTELKNAFEWMNKNRFGGRGARKVDYPYVNYILKQGDVDQSLTLDYPEFCRLLRMERKLFAVDAFGKFKTGFLTLPEAVEILKSAGYVYNENWTPFLQQYAGTNGLLNYQVLPL